MDAVNVTSNRIFSRTKFSRLEVDPRKPRKCIALKILIYTVNTLLQCLAIIETYSIQDITGVSTGVLISEWGVLL